MKIRSLLTTPLPAANPAFVYGFLVVILLLLIWDVQWLLSLPPFYPYDRYGNLVVVLSMLFSHLAYQFRWPPWVMAALRLFSWGWIVFAVFYFCYWSHILFPVKQSPP